MIIGKIEKSRFLLVALIIGLFPPHICALDKVYNKLIPPGATSIEVIERSGGKWVQLSFQLNVKYPARNATEYIKDTLARLGYSLHETPVYQLDAPEWTEYIDTAKSDEEFIVRQYLTTWIDGSYKDIVVVSIRYKKNVYSNWDDLAKFIIIEYDKGEIIFPETN